MRSLSNLAVFLLPFASPTLGYATSQRSAPIDETTYPYVQPLPSDSRSPCPALNSLANHGLLPHNGKDISVAQTIEAVYLGFSMAFDLANRTMANAIKTSTTGVKDTLNLADLNQHHPQVIEHDGSMTRADAYWGDDHTFNTTIWHRTLTSWGCAEELTFEVAATELKARFAYGVATNPQFNATFALNPSLLQYAIVISAFGDAVKGDADLTQIKYLFEKERMPWGLGYVRPTKSFGIASTTAMGLAIKALGPF